MATELGKAYVQIIPSAQGISGSIENALGGEVDKTGPSMGARLAGGLKKALVGAGIGIALKKTLDIGGDLQQSYLGGLDTLYGDAADAAREYAKEAAAAGISMNSYSEQAVSFGAALKAAYGGDTQAAMEAANTAILDMADNSAKMGTPIESVQQAYQGFAKGQYQLLDNLKLGYGGTKTEMERLLKDAQEFSGVEYDIDNLGDVYDAIHVIQGELGLTGVAADEASTTLSGSFGAMKASWDNLLGSLAIGENVNQALSDLLTSFSTWAFDNLIPMIGTIVSALPGVIVQFIQQGVPMLLQSILSLVKSLASSIQSAASGVTSEKVQKWASTMFPKMVKAAADMIGRFTKGLLSSLGKIMSALGKIGAAIIKGLGSALWGKVTQAAEGIKQRFLQPIEALKTKVSGIIEAIKGFFHFTVPTPHVPLPHFGISPAGWRVGDLLKGSIPSLSVSWYKKAEDAPYMFSNATLFGAGERNDEILYGRKALMNDIKEASQGTQITNYFTINDASDAEIVASTIVRQMKLEMRAG